MQASPRIVRHSVTIPTPEEFITKEIHNQTAKQKNRMHRRSVFDELKATENLLNDSLNKNIKPYRNSVIRITENPNSEKSLAANTNTPAPFPKENSSRPRIQLKRKSISKFKMNSEIGLKLKQLINISYQFEKACEYQKKPTKFKCQTQQNYSLPAIDEDALLPPQETSQQQKAKKQWKQKLKLGKKCIEILKEKPIFSSIRKKHLEQQSNKENSELPQSLRPTHRRPLKLQRETAPVTITKSSSFYNVNLFCNRKEQKTVVFEQRRLQQQPILKLQQFAAGGQVSVFNEYSSHLNLKEFMVQKQKFTFLKKVYNYVKENCLEMRDFTQDELNEPNLLSLVYYMENSSNLSEHEKKNIRKRLQFIQ